MKKLNDIYNKETEKMTKLDYIIIILIMFLYGILSFINLGSNENPQTFQHLEQDDAIIIELEREEDLIRTKYFSGDLAGEFAIYSSLDNINYNFVTMVSSEGAFAWNENRIPTRAKYLKILSITESSLGEMAIYNNAKERVSIKKVLLENNGEIIKKLTDEKQVVPEQISYLNSTYFDEIYFARTAYNYMNGMDAYEWTHPPLGKMLQAIPLLIFNKMTPFLYRLMGNVAGILMIYVVYLLGKLLFKKTKWAIFSALLLCFETMHFAQTRMGTVDSFLALFIILSVYFMLRYVTENKPKRSLALSGLFFGLSICVKWTGFLAGLALALIYFIDFFKNKKKLNKIVVNGFIFFVIIPVIIYIGIYLIYPKNSINYTSNLKSIIEQTEQMHSYHSELKDDHFFSSPWYSWPISYKPVWYYSEQITAKTKGSISGVGNLVIWITAIIAILYLIYKAVKSKNILIFYLLITILSLWLPYIFIGRVMFLYHYFPVTLFLIPAIVYFFKDIEEKTNKKFIVPIYLFLVMIFFIIYYPVISGLPMKNSYFETVKLFSSWYF